MPANDSTRAASLPTASGPGEIAIRKVPFDQPWVWLGAGWRDLWVQPSVSLAYGLVATVGGLVLGFALLMARMEALIPMLAGGFMLVGPVFALGLYEKSRLVAAGQPVTLADTLAAAGRSVSRIGLFVAGLLLIYFVWVRLAFLLLMLFQGTGGVPPAEDFTRTLLFTPQGLGLLVTGTAAGAILAAVVFAVTAISLPMLMERGVDALTAASVSVRAVMENIRPMGLWAVLIAGFVALGLATLGVGLVFAFPLIGHATWHAYRDLAGK